MHSPKSVLIFIVILPLTFRIFTPTSVYGIRGPNYDHPSVTGIAKIMEEGGDLHAVLPPMDAFPFLKYVALLQHIFSSQYSPGDHARYLPEFVWPWRKALGAVSRLRVELYKGVVSPLIAPNCDGRFLMPSALQIWPTPPNGVLTRALIPSRLLRACTITLGKWAPMPPKRRG